MAAFSLGKRGDGSGGVCAGAALIGAPQPSSGTPQSGFARFIAAFDRGLQEEVTHALTRSQPAHSRRRDALPESRQKETIHERTEPT
jgi:hypothetical protein